MEVPERTGEDCGRDWLTPAMLDEEDEEEEEETSSAGLLLDERENGPGKLSSEEINRDPGVVCEIDHSLFLRLYCTLQSAAYFF